MPPPWFAPIYEEFCEKLKVVPAPPDPLPADWIDLSDVQPPEEYAMAVRAMLFEAYYPEFFELVLEEISYVEFQVFSDHATGDLNHQRLSQQDNRHLQVYKDFFWVSKPRPDPRPVIEQAAVSIFEPPVVQEVEQDVEPTAQIPRQHRRNCTPASVSTESIIQRVEEDVEEIESVVKKPVVKKPVVKKPVKKSVPKTSTMKPAVPRKQRRAVCQEGPETAMDGLASAYGAALSDRAAIKAVEEMLAREAEAASLNQTQQLSSSSESRKRPSAPDSLNQSDQLSTDAPGYRKKRQTSPPQSFTRNERLSTDTSGSRKKPRTSQLPQSSGPIGQFETASPSGGRTPSQQSLSPSERSSSGSPEKKGKNSGWSAHETSALEYELKLIRAEEEARGVLRQNGIQDTELWKEASRRILAHYGVDRTFSACKSHWSRKGRESSGFDERANPNPNMLATSVQKLKGAGK